MKSSSLMEVISWPCRDCGKEHFVFLTAMFLSLIHRSSHSRLQSHSRYGVWKSLQGRKTQRFKKPTTDDDCDPSYPSHVPSVTYSNFSDTKLSKVP